MKFVTVHDWPDWQQPETAHHHLYIHDMPMVASHDVACPVCMDAKAVFDRDMTPGSQRPATFQPCWDCQAKGWRLFRLPKWLRRWAA